MERGFQEAQFPPCQPSWGRGAGAVQSDQPQEKSCPGDMSHRQCMDEPASLTHVHPCAA